MLIRFVPLYGRPSSIGKTIRGGPVSYRRYGGGRIPYPVSRTSQPWAGQGERGRGKGRGRVREREREVGVPLKAPISVHGLIQDVDQSVGN
jgi:hypothetical protein